MGLGVWDLFDPAIAPRDGNWRAYLDRVLERCTPLFSASGASIFIRDADGRFVLGAQRGAEPVIPEGASITLGHGIAGACLELKEPLLINDIRSDSTFTGRGVHARLELGSAMVVPLIMPDGTPLGVLNLSRKAGELSFGREDLRQASSLAHQIALAVGSAELLAEAEQNRAWLTKLMHCVPAAVLVLNPDGEVREANEQGRNLIQSSPSWLTPSLELGRRKLTDSDSQQIWRVDCHQAGEGRVVIAEDMTDQEYENEQHARIQRLAEIGQMSAAVAHEIRNPLTGIRAAAQMLIQYPDQAPELGEIIDDEVSRLNNLCEDFLEFARPLKLHTKPTRLSKLVSKIIRLESAIAAEAGIELVVEGPEQTPELCIDAHRVEQVLHNLLRNAIQASEPGDRCTVKLNAKSFEVIDTGSGMSERTVQNLFVPFYTTKPQGTGLGLSTSRKIIEAHGGSVHVETELGQGTRFVVELGRAA